jgi:hypothetical protein
MELFKCYADFSCEDLEVRNRIRPFRNVTGIDPRTAASLENMDAQMRRLLKNFSGSLHLFLFIGLVFLLVLGGEGQIKIHVTIH